MQTTPYMELFFIGNLKAKDGDCSNAYTQENYEHRIIILIKPEQFCFLIKSKSKFHIFKYIIVKNTLD